MSSRLPETQSAFGLIAWLEATKITLPLKGVECRFDVTAGVASVEIDQIFHQSHAEPLDCTYTFPLPDGAAVWRCEMHVNGRVIRAKVEEREAAKRIFIEQKAAGRRAALVETERGNLFTLSLGNAQPGDVIVIRLAYFQTLERAANALSLRVPVCPGVRYIPGQPLLRSLSGRGTADDTDQVSDASRISPPRIDALHPDAAYFCAEGKIARSDVADGSLSSPTHPVLIHESAAQLDLALADRGAVPDCDFVLRWTEPREAALQPRVWSFSGGGESYALVQLRAPADVAVAQDFEQDVYFLIDRSGSMEGAKWTKTCEALTSFVRLLGARDRVWITLFESTFRDFAEAPKPAPDVLADGGFQRLVELGTDGGTKLLPAAEHVLARLREHSAKRSATVIVITDGQVGNEQELLTRFRRESGITVHAFGIDTAVNDAFLKSLARQQGGECWLQTPDDDIAATVAGLADRLRRPVITDLEIRGAWELGGTCLPNVHAGQIVEISLRLPAGKPDAIEIAGRLGSGERHVFPLAVQSCANPALPLLWACERLSTLLADGQKSAALALAKQHNILCEGAAFIAWDESERVQVAQREIYQPSLELDACHLMSCEAASPKAGLMMEYFDSLYDARPSSQGAGGDEDLGVRLIARMAGAREDEPEMTEDKDDLAALLIATGVHAPLAKWLAAWANAGWANKGARRTLLRELLEVLRASATAGVAEICEICREFLDAQLTTTPSDHAVASRLLRVWKARAGVTISGQNRAG